MLKVYLKFSTFVLGMLMLTGLTNKTYAQCDPKFTGASYKNTAVVANVATILVGQTAQLEFNFGVGQQPTCTAAAGNVAGSITVTIVFPAEYSPLAGVTVGGTQSSLYNWLYNPATRTLVGVNNATIPPSVVAAKFTVDVTGNAPTPGTTIALTTLAFSTTSTPPITNSTNGNDGLSAGVNVDPVPPVATPDATSTGHDTNVNISVLTNDTPGGAPLDPASVKLIDPLTGNPVTSVTVPGEGVYTVNPDGTITFDPDPAFVSGTVTPIMYTVTDTNGQTSNQATITVTVGALPVTLSRFVAAKEGKTAQLSWATTEESNSDRFEIERSLNGKDWGKIGTIASHGEGIIKRYYSYSDENPANGENLYRLKMIDRDETFAHSGVRSVKFEGLDADLSVYPNPVSDVLKIRDYSQVTKVSIIDMNGRTVHESGKTSTGEISVRSLTSGIYLVRINRANGLTSSQKIVVGK
ncbi:T9SS type A sorting domain-containing protein [Dyadobacter psychrotolerans]|uniref:T9SS type A sorting domain-containing protein n=1 Tax=Dyadobacter psychrotolerans TaxID=2541721 RepID=A0A4R5DQB8_9BACT|nr:T9SS type A sorting domain-containing protein [Dyadobacter psychrotolerans]TDE14424.1 T9SS type A sorting domain-containing protein [Dyadobacter psychrotolerans]